LDAEVLLSSRGGRYTQKVLYCQDYAVATAMGGGG
jgi:hypothetical protein